MFAHPEIGGNIGSESLSSFILLEEMTILINDLLPLGALLLSCTVQTLQGQEHMFLDEYKESIQDYIMTGHENGWKDCDVLSFNTVSHEMPQFSFEVDKIENLIKKSAFAFSNCLLVNYEVGSEIILSALLDFGWAAINQVRLALVLELGSDITFGSPITNTTKLPFLVATKSGQLKKQFICPVIGEVGPRFDQEMCKRSYVFYKNKNLRVTHMGIPPHFLFTSDGHLDGTNMRIMRILEDELQFQSTIVVAKSFKHGADLV